MTFPPPSEFGAPASFNSWRAGQGEAFESLLRAQTRFKVVCAPPGIGKTVMGMTYAALTEGAALGLTVTKGLQDQYQADFGGPAKMGLGDVRGMANYPCPLLQNQYGCDEGPCLDGEKCRYREKGCPYYDTLAAAKRRQWNVSNYDWWLTQVRSGKEKEWDLKLLICDEAHELPRKLTSFLAVSLGPSEVRIPENAQQMDRELWQEWARGEKDRVDRLLRQLGPGPRRRGLRRLVEKLAVVAGLPDDWVPYTDWKGSTWTFEPLWPGKYASMLWGEVPNVLFLSATVRPQHMARLGLKEEDYTWIECPSPFPVKSRPLYHLPTLKCKEPMSPSQVGLWIDRMDTVIRPRLDRKGLIHPVSYRRGQLIKDRSEFGDIMLVVDPKERNSQKTRELIQRFKEGPAPMILVNPTIHTGHDFALDLARYQFIPKMPWPDTRSGIEAARAAEDKRYGLAHALDQFMQMYGRIVRLMGDWGETFVFDDQVGWMVWRNQDLVCQWVREAYQKLDGLPPPPPLR